MTTRRVPPPWRTGFALTGITLLSFFGAQPAAARVLDEIRVSRTGAEATVEIEFVCALRYLGHGPEREGAELEIRLEPGFDCLHALGGTPNDARRPRGGRMAALAEIELSRDRGRNATLTLRFEQPVAFSIRQTGNVHMLTVVVDTSAPAAAPPVTVQAPPLPAEPLPAPVADNRRMSRQVTSPPPLERNRFVVRAAVIADEDDIDRGALQPLREKTIYTNSVVVGGRRWTELRVGFFDTEAEAQSALAALTTAYPSAWITVAGPEEQSGAVARALGWPAPPAEAPKPPAAATRPDPAAAGLTAEAQSALLAEARAALVRRDYATGIGIYTRLLGVPGGVHAREARELLGVAHEKAGRSDQAQAEYEAYLRDYRDSVDSPTAGRVRQRLAALTVPAVPARQEAVALAETVDARDSADWQFFGGVSQDYLRGVSLGQDDRADVVAQSALLSRARFVARRRGARFDFEARGNGGVLYDFEDEEAGEQALVSYAYLDLNDTKLGASARLGRQRQQSGGVLGRFDGLHASLRLRPNLRVNVTSGFPVDSPRFRATSDQYFYGASVDLLNVREAWEFSLFANQQVVDGIDDRQAVGAEARFRGERLSVIGLLDYDGSYNIVNTALVTANWRAHDRLTLYGQWRGGVAPFLTTRNAIIGQPVNTVRELFATYSEGQIRRLARNRTADERAGTAGLSAAITPRLQLKTEFSYLEYSGTVASGGVAAFPGTGPQYSYGGQLVGSGFGHQANVFVAGYRHDERRSIDDDTVWLDLRFPLGRSWRVQARLEVSQRLADQDAAGDIEQWIGRPVLRATYAGGRRYRIDFEIGGQRSDREYPEPLAPPGLVDNTAEQTDYYLRLGYRLDL